MSTKNVNVPPPRPLHYAHLPSDLQTLRQFEWEKTFDAASLEDLIDLEAWLSGVHHSLLSRLQHKIGREFNHYKLPIEAQRLCNEAAESASAAAASESGTGAGACTGPGLGSNRGTGTETAAGAELASATNSDSDPGTGTATGAGTVTGANLSSDLGAGAGTRSAAITEGCVFGSEDHRHLIRATARHVVKIAPVAHVSPPMKAQLRRLLGLGRSFTLNLTWAEAWKPLQEGCAARMRRLGAQLDGIFKADGLGSLLGTYDPGMLAELPRLGSCGGGGCARGSAGALVPQMSSESDSSPLTAQPTSSRKNLEVARAETAGQHVDTEPLVFQPLVPDACRPHTFTGFDVVSEDDRECAYIHFLRLVGLALDQSFQQAVHAAFDTAGVQIVGGGVFSRGIKSYERMANKMHSRDDHRFRPLPRPRFNVDVVRCLATFESAADMRRGFDAVKSVFDGDCFAKFKNGMAWSHSRAAARYHLRVVLATGLFSLPNHRTIGALRSDSSVQKIWSSYLSNQPRPPSVSPGTWQRQIALALKWLGSMPSHVEVSLLCEVQMLLRKYRDVRAAMHEPYKIVRAGNPAQLYNDFVKYETARLSQDEFAQDGSTPLKRACRDGDADVLGSLLLELDSSSQQPIRASNPRASAQKPEPAETSFSLTDANLLDDALCIACKYVRLACVRLLLSYHAPTRHVTGPGLSTALLHATLGRAPGRDAVDLDASRSGIVQLLLFTKASVETARGDGGTATYIAAAEGHVKILRVLLAAKAVVNTAALDGTTPLYMAAHHGHSSAVELLLSAKADADSEDKNGATPIYIAAQDGHVQEIQVLVAAKADVNHPRQNGVTPAYMAAQNGHTRAVRLLCAAKVDPNQCEHADGTSPIYLAAQNGHTDVVSALLEGKADPDRPRNTGFANVFPVFVAAQRGFEDIVKLLLRAKAKPDRVVASSTTALLIAIQQGHDEAVEVLLNGRANPNRAVSGGITPVYVAAQGGHEKALRLLLNAKGDPAQPRHGGISPAYVASENGHLLTLGMLLAAKADPNAPEHDGTTPLYMAAQNNHAQVVRALLLARADPNHTRASGDSPLVVAACKNSLEAAQELVQSGQCKVHRVAPDGNTAASWALKMGHRELADLLQAVNATAPDSLSDSDTTVDSMD